MNPIIKRKSTDKGVVIKNQMKSEFDLSYIRQFDKAVLYASEINLSSVSPSITTVKSLLFTYGCMVSRAKLHTKKCVA